MFAYIDCKCVSTVVTDDRPFTKSEVKIKPSSLNVRPLSDNVSIIIVSLMAFSSYNRNGHI